MQENVSYRVDENVKKTIKKCQFVNLFAPALISGASLDCVNKPRPHPAMESFIFFVVCGGLAKRSYFATTS